MGLDKFLSVVNGLTKRIDAVKTGGAGSEDSIVSTGVTGLLDITLLPAGIGTETIAIEASENISAGNFVNIWDDLGTVKVRKALGELGKTADGFVLSSFLNGEIATVYLEGRNTALSGLSLAQTYWLSDVSAGAVTTTPPTSGANKAVQLLGKSYSATAMTTDGLATNYVILES